jgi:hypothetical protein
MSVQRLGLVAAIALLAGCTAPNGPATDQETGFIEELPEGVLAVAAPYQNLRAVRISPEDGCYWYFHDGPVESTLLPLRTTKGNPICTEAGLQPSGAG